MTRLPQDVVELLEVAATHPEGIAPLLEGHLESVAALYQLRPNDVERVRDCISVLGVEARAQVLALVSDRRFARPQPALRHPAPRDVAALIAAAMRTPNGVEFLQHAPVETAAVLFQAHPFVVEAARERLATRRAPTGEHPLPFIPPARESAPRFWSQP